MALVWQGFWTKKGYGPVKRLSSPSFQALETHLVHAVLTNGCNLSNHHKYDRIIPVQVIIAAHAPDSSI